MFNLGLYVTPFSHLNQTKPSYSAKIVSSQSKINPVWLLMQEKFNFWFLFGIKILNPKQPANQKSFLPLFF